MEEAQRVTCAPAAGRSYETSLEWEYENGPISARRGTRSRPIARAVAGRAWGGAAGRPATAAAPAAGARLPDGRGRGGGAAAAAAPPGRQRSRGGRPRRQRRRRPTALTFAAREGDLASARKLLDAGADVNQPTEYGWTPLLTAVNNRNYKLATLLLERGADPNLANKGGWTPLYIATDNRNIEGGDYPVPKPDLDHLEMIATLLDKGARPNTPIKENTLTRTIFTMQWFWEDGATPFVRAAQSSDTELMKLLLEHGADPKALPPTATTR